MSQNITLTSVRGMLPLEIQLYNYFRSSSSYRVRIALHLKSLEFEYKAVHLLKNGGEQHTTAFQQLNAHKEVPALVHDGQAISQSVAIIEYLDQVFPHPPLYPKEPTARARVQQICEIINCTQPLQNLKLINYLKTHFNMTESQQASWLNHWLGQTFSTLETMLKNTHGKFCFGDQVSAADLFLIPQIFSADRFGIDMTHFPLLRQINNNCMSLDAFQKAHPKNQPDTPADLK